MRKYILLYLIICTIPFISFSQARLMINNNAYVRMNGGTAATPIYIVVDNPNANAVSTLGTGGNLVSEGEWNMLRWNIGTTTGTYVLPLTSNPATTNFKYPLSVQITGAGVGAGRIDFSSYETTTDMNLPWASLVTHMTDADNPPADNSLKVEDRYWIINANGYATRPAVNMTFGYVDNASELGGANLITEANLVAQRWNSSLNKWEGNFTNTAIMYGAANTVANNVSGVAIPASEFWEVWVLVDKTSLLPVELISINGECNNGKKSIKWETASEINASHYSIEKSVNGVDYLVIGNIPAAGNSNTIQEYIFNDVTSSFGNYYRVTQFDQNGQSSVLPLVYIEGCNDINNDFTIYPDNNNNVSIFYNASETDDLHISIYSVDGKLVAQKNVSASEGNNTFLMPYDFATGNYHIVIQSEKTFYSQKIYLTKK